MTTFVISEMKYCLLLWLLAEVSDPSKITFSKSVCNRTLHGPRRLSDRFQTVTHYDTSAAHVLSCDQKVKDQGHNRQKREHDVHIIDLHVHLHFKDSDIFDFDLCTYKPKTQGL